MDDEAPNTRRMSEEEKEGYRGITLSENGEEETRQKPFGQNVRVHVWNTADMPWWKKAVTYGLIAAGVCAFLVLAWFFLIGGLVIAGAFAVVYYLKKLLMK